MKKTILFLSIISLLIISGCDSSNKTSNSIDYVKSVWWWDNELSIDYLNFAREYKISEIYYCDTRFNEETINFIEKANSYNMDVYCLVGEYQWINDYESLENVINEYLVFQENNIVNFSGIHFDVEPHQHPEFDARRNEIITDFVEMVIYLNDKYDIEFHYDIPFWLDDNVCIKDNNKEAFKWIIDNSDRVVVMSYRDSKDAILDIVKEEVEYAVSNNKEIMISVETYSTEGDFVSFNEEGKEIMNNVIEDIFNEEHAGLMGVAIHHIESWYNLK